MTNAMPERTAIWKHDEANQLMPMLRKRADLREDFVLLVVINISKGMASDCIWALGGLGSGFLGK